MAVSRRSIVAGFTITAISLAIVASASRGTGGTEASAPARVAPAQPSDCFARLPADPGAATALGRVHFFGNGKGWHQGDELQVGANRNGKRDAKQAIAIRGHDLVTLQVPAKARRSVDLVGWGTNNARDKADIIRIQLDADSPCAESEWAAYPGGFTFTRKQCFRLDVKADERTATVPFGFGKSCN